MFDLINQLIGVNHLIISVIFLIPIFFIILCKDNLFLKRLLFFLLIVNLFSFYIILFITNSFDYRVHLPLHLCYITELAILISLFFNTKAVYPWLVLNSMLGGLVGFINSNLPLGSSLIEYSHFYLSHFNLLLFTIIVFKLNISISFFNLLRSIAFNTFLLIQVSIFNIIFSTNYWFTVSKPSGINLSSLFPEWPYYLFIFIAFGLISYSITFFLLSSNRVQK